MSTTAPEGRVCFSCSKAASRTVLASPQCIARLHALISPKRWGEMEQHSYGGFGASIQRGHYIGRERDLPGEGPS